LKYKRRVTGFMYDTSHDRFIPERENGNNASPHCVISNEQERRGEFMKSRRIANWLLMLITAACANAQVERDAGSWPTWVISNQGTTFELPPPPSGAQAKEEADDLKLLATQRDDAAVNLVRFWDAGAPAYRWIQIAQQEVANHNLGGPAATRVMSLVAVAIQDATVSAWAWKYAYGRLRPAQFDAGVVPLIETPNSPSYPSEYAVAATAASKVLSYLFSERRPALESMAADAGISRLYAGVEFASDLTAGTRLGGMVADQVIAWAKRDGSDAPFTGAFAPAPGKWNSPTPAFPLAGAWKPWALSSGSQARLAPPPSFGTPEMIAQIDGLKNFARTVQTNQIAWFWQPSFIDPWIDTTNQMLFENHIDRDPPLAARIYALTAVAQHDATIACWDTKYTYLEMRPIQADSTVQTLFPTPAHPSYPSGHACASGAAATALGAVFPGAAATLTARAKEGGLSTFYAGIHYQIDVDQGLALGQEAAKAAVERSGVTPLPIGPR
jgi:membrane-associated phospholipid phosphatase